MKWRNPLSPKTAKMSPRRTRAMAEAIFMAGQVERRKRDLGSESPDLFQGRAEEGGTKSLGTRVFVDEIDNI